MAGASLSVSSAEFSRSGTPTLTGVDLDICGGEHLAIVGPSGAGKTTLLRLLGGALFPIEGTVLMDGQSWSDLRGGVLREARSRVGFVHQDHALIPNLRVLHNVLAGRFGRSSRLQALRSMLWPRVSEQEAVLALLDRLGVGDKIFHRVDTLSGGEQQRVAIARALYQNPCVLLADEPVASVDPARARSILALLIEIATESDLTLAVSLHDFRLARELFPRLVGLRKGAIVFDESPEEVTEKVMADLYSLESE